MVFNRDAARVSIGIAGAGTLLKVLMDVSILVIGFQFLREPTVLPFFAMRWNAVAAVGAYGWVFGTPLLAAIGAFYLMTTGRTTLRTNVAGFGLGGGVFWLGGAFGLALINWSNATVTRPFLDYLHLQGSLHLLVLFIGMAVLGALAGDLTRPLVRMEQPTQ